MALAFAPLQQELTVLRINAEERMKRHLENLGLGAGARLTMVSQAGGDVILAVKSGRLALNRGLAMKIIVAG